jgi:hypothetical protein
MVKRTSHLFSCSRVDLPVGSSAYARSGESARKEQLYDHQHENPYTDDAIDMKECLLYAAQIIGPDKVVLVS